MPRVRVYMACSLDGFIAAPDNDIGWLGEDYARPDDPATDPDALGFEDFMAQIGSMLMGRTTYDTVQAMGQWPYGDTPVVVATTRPLEPIADTVVAAKGTIEQLVAQAKALAGDRDVYLDGGALTRQALNAGLVDEIVATFVPILLTSGTRLFDGLVARQSVQFVRSGSLGRGLMQMTVRVLGNGSVG